MSTFTVKSASHKKDVDGKHGPMQVIALALKDNSTAQEFDAEWFTKASTEVPASGTTIEGTVEDSQYGKKFKKAFQGGGGGRGRSPEETRAIQRQHSQEMALRALTLLGTPPSIKEAGGATREERAREAIVAWTDWFDADIAEAVGNARSRVPGDTPQSAPAPSSQPPADATPNQKRALTTALNRLGIDNPWQAKIVHAVAGNPPTFAGLSSLLDVVNDTGFSEREKIDRLQEMAGIQMGGGDAPADTSDLPDPEAVPF